MQSAQQLRARHGQDFASSIPGNALSPAAVEELQGQSLFRKIGAALSQTALDELRYTLVLNRRELLRDRGAAAGPPELWSPAPAPAAYDPYPAWSLTDEADAVWAEVRLEGQKVAKNLNWESLPEMADEVRGLTVTHPRYGVRFLYDLLAGALAVNMKLPRRAQGLRGKGGDAEAMAPAAAARTFVAVLQPLYQVECHVQ